eukprot:Pgem_evm1s14510
MPFHHHSNSVQPSPCYTEPSSLSSQEDAAGLSKQPNILVNPQLYVEDKTAKVHEPNKVLDWQVPIKPHGRFIFFWDLVKSFFFLVIAFL